MTIRYSTGVRQHFTHRELFPHAEHRLGFSRAAALDAIIVPASRAAENLDQAIALADNVRCKLVLLCSKQARAEDVSQLLDERKFSNATVIELPPDYHHDLFEFDTSCRSNLPDSSAIRDTDLSMKRNVGLMLARMLRWEGVFFLDDDIAFDPAALRYATSLLRTHKTVGLRVDNFPDNSVVCHAHRQTGGRQDVLVSGSALAVNCTASMGFFPDIYNEDWFFFYKDVAKRRLRYSGLRAMQLPYDPFADPERAQGQEFGDILAEGLYTLLHMGDRQPPDRDYWKQFLAARESFLSAIIDRLGAAQPHTQEKIRAAVEAARQCLEEIQPEICENYVRIWKDDLSRWKRRLKAMPSLRSITDALSQLGLAAAETVSAHGTRSYVATAPDRLRSLALDTKSAGMRGEPSAGAAHITVTAVTADDDSREGHTRRHRLTRGLSAAAAGASWEMLAQVNKLTVLSSASVVMFLRTQWPGLLALSTGRLPDPWPAIRRSRWHNSPGPPVTPTPPHATAEMERLP